MEAQPPQAQPSQCHRCSAELLPPEQSNPRNSSLPSREGFWAPSITCLLGGTDLLRLIPLLFLPRQAEFGLELLGGREPARFPRIAGEIQLLPVSDCLQFAVIPNQLSLDGSFSSALAAKL